MADISKELKNFKSAVYGEDVRDSLISAISAINREVEESKKYVAPMNKTPQKGEISIDEATQPGVIYIYAKELYLERGIILVASDWTGGMQFLFQAKEQAKKSDEPEESNKPKYPTGVIRCRYFKLDGPGYKFQNWIDMTQQIKIDSKDIEDIENVIQECVNTYLSDQTHVYTTSALGVDNDHPSGLISNLPIVSPTEGEDPFPEDLKIPTVAYLKKYSQLRFVNAWDYGFRGNGTAADTEIFQNLLDNYSYIYLPAKKGSSGSDNEPEDQYSLYNPSRAAGSGNLKKPILTITRPVWLIGDGHNSTIIRGFQVSHATEYPEVNTQVKPVISIDVTTNATDRHGVRIEGIGFIGTKAIHYSGPNQLAGYDQNAPGGSVIEINSSYETVLKDIKVSKGACYGVHITSAARDTIISDSFFVGNNLSGLHNEGYGTEVSNIISISNRKCVVGDYKFASGISTETPISITNSKFYTNDLDGVLLKGAHGCTISTINSQQNGRHGICMVPKYNEKTMELERACESNTITNFICVANNWIATDKITSEPQPSSNHGCGVLLSGFYNQLQGLDVPAQENWNATWSSIEEASLRIDSPQTTNNIVQLTVSTGFNGPNKYDSYFNAYGNAFNYPEFKYVDSTPPLSVNDIFINNTKETDDITFTNLIEPGNAAQYTDDAKLSTYYTSSGNSSTKIHIELKYPKIELNTVEDRKFMPGLIKKEGSDSSEYMHSFFIAMYRKVIASDSGMLFGSNADYSFRKTPDYDSEHADPSKYFITIGGKTRNGKNVYLLTALSKSIRYCVPRLVPVQDESSQNDFEQPIYSHKEIAVESNESNYTQDSKQYSLKITPIHTRYYNIPIESGTNPTRIYLKIKSKINTQSTQFKNWIVIPSIQIKATVQDTTTLQDKTISRPAGSYVRNVKKACVFDNSGAEQILVYDFTAFSNTKCCTNDIITILDNKNLHCPIIKNIYLYLSVYKVTNDASGLPTYSDDDTGETKGVLDTFDFDIDKLEYCFGYDPLYSCENKTYEALPKYGYYFTTAGPVTSEERVYF